MKTVVDTQQQIEQQQIEQEQMAIDAMHARLDAEVAAARSARERVMASPVEGPEAHYARDVELSRLTGIVGRLQLAEQSLCFGRIDAVEGGETLHVGRVGLRSASGEMLLVDWRAEAARPFYAATPVSPQGLRRRRHLRIEGRTVVEVTDEILDGSAPTEADVVGDGPLVSALNGARTGRMREAAATLQREQDEIVRSEHRGIMIVDGGPGTGKTIVALHRAAYVLYAFPAIAERGVLIFGPNRRFLSYISGVLPSLGENDVALATASDLIGIEALRMESDDTARLKGRKVFAAALAQWVRSHQPHGVALRLHTAHGSVVLDSARVDEARHSALQGGLGHNRARELFVEHIVNESVNDLEQATAKEVSDFEAELKDVFGIDLDRMFAADPDGAGPAEAAASAGELDIDWDRIREDLLDDAVVDRAVEEVWPRLQAEDVVRGALSDRAALARLLPELTDDDAAALAAGIHTDIRAETRAAWSNADLALLDEARALVDGPPEKTYGHIVIDEGQLLSEMQHRMLMRRCPSRSMTIVGDLAQAGPTTTVESWAEAIEPFVGDRYAHHSLTINYRTTAEILEASAPVLARIAPAQRLSRSIRRGERPSSITVPDDEVVSALDRVIAQERAEHPGELIGVVAASQRATELDARGFGTDTTVVAAPDARGLEFDAVIIVCPDEIEDAGAAGLRDLYVAQTRATKRLVTLTTDPVGTRARPPERR